MFVPLRRWRDGLRLIHATNWAWLWRRSRPDVIAAFARMAWFWRMPDVFVGELFVLEVQFIFLSFRGNNEEVRCEPWLVVVGYCGFWVGSWSY